MPKRKPDADTLIENILESHDPEVRALVEHLRKIIRETVPDATESAHPVWHSIGYRHPESGYFCGIFPQNDGVNLAFEFGVLLPDPGGLLEGDGKQVRYVRIRRDKDIRVRALKKLLLAAIDLPASRDVKLGLIRSSARPVSEDD
ncbi:MAG TPA: DUF1801 domain-containing protein [Anaerolineae bacterium]|nr:DUF1801 domain-containing protein [Anaerolineae bacterium]